MDEKGFLIGLINEARRVFTSRKWVDYLVLVRIIIDRRLSISGSSGSSYSLKWIRQLRRLFNQVIPREERRRNPKAKSLEKTIELQYSPICLRYWPQLEKHRVLTAISTSSVRRAAPVFVPQSLTLRSSEAGRHHHLAVRRECHCPDRI
jgi:3-polyprenyl-4-hydroxybenzoate decarboxylase